MTRPDLVLASLLRRALEDWQGDVVSGPWDDIIDLLVCALADGRFELEDAASFQFLLRRTRGQEPEGQCSVCSCPAPGLTHALGEGRPPEWWPEEAHREVPGGGGGR